MLIKIVLIVSVIFNYSNNNWILAQITHVSINSHCEDNSECGDFFSVCANNLCVCQPNYEFIDGKCRKFTCHNNAQCQQYDRNRLCDSRGRCVCKPSYNEHYNNLKCEIFCDSNIDCGVNEFCHKNQCKCRVNYLLVNGTNHCAYFSCRKDSDCWTADNKRYCKHGVCICENNFYEDNGSMRCLSAASFSYDRHNSIALWLMIFVIIGSAIAVLLYIRHKAGIYRRGFTPIPQNV